MLVPEGRKIGPRHRKEGARRHHPPRREAAKTPHRSKAPYADRCPIRDVLERLGDRWTKLVPFTLESNGTLRFSALKAEIADSSQHMLAQTLRRVEQDGRVSRRTYPTVPPRVDLRADGAGPVGLKPRAPAGRAHRVAIHPGTAAAAGCRGVGLGCRIRLRPAAERELGCSMPGRSWSTGCRPDRGLGVLSAGRAQGRGLRPAPDRGPAQATG
jgi:DNA-binding HxlR family transcriptional regulator